MRAKYDMLKQKTRAELTGVDRKALGKAIEVLTNLQVCEQVEVGVLGTAENTADRLGEILEAYPAPKASKAKVSCVDTK